MGLLGTQCLDSISDDCTKTLTCPDDPPPTLNEATCEWEYPDGRPWLGGPTYDLATRTWRWPDGKATETQQFDCNLGSLDAGVDAGPTGPDCRVNFECDPGQSCHPDTGACVECITSAECAGNMAMGDAGAATVCDTSSHRCVECLGNGDCSGDTDVCKTDAGNTRRNACVECLVDGHCSAPTPICDDRSNDCTARCQTASDCTGDKRACNTERALCVECTDNSHCSGTPGKPLCDTESNQCVECLDDGPCNAGGSSRVCDLESHSCVECREDAQCTDGLPFCETETKQCVQCLNDQQCLLGTASRCNAAHVCTGCTDNNQCENGAQCRDGECVECLNNSHCTFDPERPFCETSRGQCVGCFESSQCRSAALAHCETAQGASSDTRYTCVGCVTNQDCTGDGKTLPPLCDPARGGGTCSECTVAEGAADCFESGPGLSRCQNGTCSVCSVDADCALFAGAPSNLPACKPGTGCVECTESADCTDTADTPVCKLAAGGGPAAINTCVQCLTNSDCRTTADASLCQNNQCVPCDSDDDCSLVDSNGAANGGTPLNVCDAGTCVQCTGPKRGACGEDVCNSLAKTCAVGRTFRGAGVCESCVSDLECAENARCVQQTFGGQNVGFFCFPLATGTPATCAGPRIFLGATTSATIDQQQPTPTVCQPRRTTCAALDALAEAVDCDNAADCGVPNLDDGICDPALDLCTVPCSGGADCAGTCDLEAGACEP